MVEIDLLSYLLYRQIDKKKRSSYVSVNHFIKVVTKNPGSTAAFENNMARG